MATKTPATDAVAKKLDDLVFYAVDKASPYALAQDPASDSVEQLGDATLSSLAITGHGAAIMWLWINAHCQPQAKPVGASVASHCSTVSEVREAVQNNRTDKA